MSQPGVELQAFKSGYELQTFNLYQILSTIQEIELLYQRGRCNFEIRLQVGERCMIVSIGCINDRNLQGCFDPLPTLFEVYLNYCNFRLDIGYGGCEKRLFQDTTPDAPEGGFSRIITEILRLHSIVTGDYSQINYEDTAKRANEAILGSGRLAHLLAIRIFLQHHSRIHLIHKSRIHGVPVDSDGLGFRLRIGYKNSQFICIYCKFDEYRLGDVSGYVSGVVRVSLYNYSRNFNGIVLGYENRSKLIEWDATPGAPEGGYSSLIDELLRLESFI
jgi:hypothetical protein